VGTSDSPSSAVDELADTFAEVARTLQAELSLQATLEKIVELAPKTIDGCQHAGVTLVKSGKMRTPAASDDVPGQVDAIQYETGEGPCLDAEDRAEGSIFAAHAAVALSAANQQDQLEQGMESRDVIGPAKCILMARQHITADEASTALRLEANVGRAAGTPLLDG